MDSTAFDDDEILTLFLTDYLDGNLSGAERRSFEEYLSRNERERHFAQSARKGKEILSRYAHRLDIASPEDQAPG